MKGGRADVPMTVIFFSSPIFVVQRFKRALPLTAVKLVRAEFAISFSLSVMKYSYSADTGKNQQHLADGGAATLLAQYRYQVDKAI